MWGRLVCWIRAGGGGMRVGGGTVWNTLKGVEQKRREGKQRFKKGGGGKLGQGVRALKRERLEPPCKLWEFRKCLLEEQKVLPPFQYIFQCCQGGVFFWKWADYDLKILKMTCTGEEDKSFGNFHVLYCNRCVNVN